MMLNSSNIQTEKEELIYTANEEYLRKRRNGISGKSSNIVLNSDGTFVIMSQNSPSPTQNKKITNNKKKSFGLTIETSTSQSECQSPIHSAGNSFDFFIIVKWCCVNTSQAMLLWRLRKIVLVPINRIHPTQSLLLSPQHHPLTLFLSSNIQKHENKTNTSLYACNGYFWYSYVIWMESGSLLYSRVPSSCPTLFYNHLQIYLFS